MARRGFHIIVGVCYSKVSKYTFAKTHLGYLTINRNFIANLSFACKIIQRCLNLRKALIQDSPGKKCTLWSRASEICGELCVRDGKNPVSSKQQIPPKEFKQPMKNGKLRCATVGFV